jgi:hypothetical protein
LRTSEEITNVLKSVFSVACVLLSGSALADWHTVVVTNIALVADTTAGILPGVPANTVVVWGNFTPALPCATQAFIFFPADPLYKETYSMLVVAQLTGTPIRYLHIYCQDSGISRGNQYRLGN